MIALVQYVKNSLNSGPKMRLERFEIQKISSGLVAFQPHLRPRPFGPRRILAPTWQKASCAYVYGLIRKRGGTPAFF